MSNLPPRDIIPPLGEPSRPQPRLIVDSTTGRLVPLPTYPDLSGVFHISQSATREIDPEVRQLVTLKQAEYTKRARQFRLLHYMLLTTAASLSILTPFLIPVAPLVAQVSAIVVALLLATDQIFKPKDRWSLYSKSTDLLQLQLFKVSGRYESNKGLIDTIIETEAQILNTVPDLNEVLQKVAESSGKTRGEVETA